MTVCLTDNVLPEMLEAVFLKIGLASSIPVTLEGLESVFQAWCRSTGYDNVGLAVRAGAGEEGPVLGFPASDYFERLITHGMSNLCFGNSEALRVLLLALGFTAERARGSMGSTEAVLGAYRHGTLIVTIDGAKYVVDSTFLAERALLLNPGQRTSAGAGPLRIWSDVDGTIRWQIPQGRFHAAFKIEEIGCSFETFREEHERTQEGLAHGRLYKHRLFVRRNVDGGTRTYDNGSIITKAAGQFVVRKVVPEEMPLILTEEFGLSAEIVQKIPVGYYEQAGSRPVPLRSAN